MRAVRTVDDGRRHVLKPLVDPDVWSSVRRDSLDLRHTSLDMGVTVLMARSKTSSGQPAMLGHHTAKALVGETTMNADALPPDIDPESRCRLPLPNRDDLDEAGKQTFDLMSDPHGGSLAGLRGPGGLRLHSPRVSAGLRPVNTYLRYAAGIEACAYLQHVRARTGVSTGHQDYLSQSSRSARASSGLGSGAARGATD